jgi:hypothetical protein
MKTEILTENVVVIFDPMRSSGEKKDFSQKWLQIALKGLGIYAEEKTRIDATDRVAFLLTGSPPIILGTFEDPPKTTVGKLDKRNVTFDLGSGASSEIIADSLKTAIDLLVERIKQLGNQTFRILLFTSLPRIEITDSLRQLVQNAGGLNISIDVCIFHEEKVIVSREEYLFITNTTKGELGYFYRDKALFTAMKGFASKRLLDDPQLRLLSPNEKADGKFLAEIASPLVPLSDEEKAQYLKNPQSTKCQVCFSHKCPTGTHDFANCGRVCPNCNRPIHLHCAAMWAQKAEVAPNLFRCPACYILLKIPPSLSRGLKLKEQRKARQQTSPEIKMVRVKEENLGSSPEICGFCFTPITGDSVVADRTGQKIFQCSLCGAQYHTSCLEKMYKVGKTCQNCGGTIV